jgi:hypothetical protein
LSFSKEAWIFGISATGVVFLLRVLLDTRRTRAAMAAHQSIGEHALYVRIPGHLLPLERGTSFEDPLNDALERAGLGAVTGAGSKIGSDGSVEYCEIDVQVADRVQGLALVIGTLRRLSAPQGTVVQELGPPVIEHPVYGG